MKIDSRNRRCWYLLLLAALSWQAGAQGIIDRQLGIQAFKHSDYGLHYLRNSQSPNGAWSGSVHITALALRAFLGSYQRYNESDGAFVTRPVKYLLDNVRDDGAISDGHHDPVLDTALAISALHATKNPSYKAVIDNGQRYLLSQQIDERRGVEPSAPQYGGVSAPGQKPADLPKQYQVIEAIHLTGLSPSHPFWEKSARFMERQQNLQASNDQSWAGNDGGFTQSSTAGSEKAHRSSRAMTYMGLASLLRSGADSQDPRVAAALEWTRENPPSVPTPATEPLPYQYRYYVAFASVMRMLGKPNLEDSQGNKYNWRNTLIRQLLAQYNEDGSWKNPSAATMESDPLVATALSVIALNQIAHSLR